MYQRFPSFPFPKQSGHHSLSIKAIVESVFNPHSFVFVSTVNNITMGFLYSNIPLIRCAISLLLAICTLIPGSLCCDSCLYKSKLVYHSQPPLPEIINGMYVQRISPRSYLDSVLRMNAEYAPILIIWDVKFHYEFCFNLSNYESRFIFYIKFKMVAPLLKVTKSHHDLTCLGLQMHHVSMGRMQQIS